MSRIPLSASIAIATPDIDISYNTLTDPGGIITFQNRPHEFMTRNTFKVVIPLQQLYIRIADAHTPNTNHCLIRFRQRIGSLDDAHLLIFEIYRLHAILLPLTRMLEFIGIQIAIILSNGYPSRVR
jgi:hypothetical protein